MRVLAKAAVNSGGWGSEEQPSAIALATTTTMLTTILRFESLIPLGTSLPYHHSSPG